MFKNKYFGVIGILLCIIALAGCVTPTPLSLQEQVRDSVMDYIKCKHPETALFMYDLDWTGGYIPPLLLGAETYMYYSHGWNFAISYPVVPNPIYKIKAEYSDYIPDRIIWQGTWQSGTINEISYVFVL